MEKYKFFTLNIKIFGKVFSFHFISFYVYVYESFACIFLFVWFPWKAGKSIRCPGPGVTNSDKPLYEFWESILPAHKTQEESIPFIHEPFFLCFKWK